MVAQSDKKAQLSTTKKELENKYGRIPNLEKKSAQSGNMCKINLLFLFLDIPFIASKVAFGLKKFMQYLVQNAIKAKYFSQYSVDAAGIHSVILQEVNMNYIFHVNLKYETNKQKIIVTL